MPVACVSPIFQRDVRHICDRPYQGHKKGCPNFNKKPSCPPRAKLYPDVYDLTRAVVAVWNIFDLKAHVERMRAKHPDWSWRQLVNCLYWQGTARKELRRLVKAELAAYPGRRAETIPEAMGINVTATMASVGVILEWPPVTKTIQVALVAFPKQLPLDLAGNPR